MEKMENIKKIDKELKKVSEDFNLGEGIPEEQIIENVKSFLQRNFRVDVPSFFNLSDTGSDWTELVNADISPEDFGNFSFLFKTANLKIKAATNSAEYPGYVWMYIQYSYTHPGGGSNGLTTRYISKDNGKTFNQG